jgi:hypothetical protein
MTRWWHSAPATRVRHSVALLTERRAVLLISVDALFLFAGLMMGLMGGTGSAKDLYAPMFLMPALLIGVPILADVVAVERRSGTLDLALTSPGARFYFERRIASIAVLMVIQGVVAMLFAFLALQRFPLPVAFLQIVIVSAFLGCVVLHWAVRLKSAGAVIFATYATALVFTPWLFSRPVYPYAPKPMDLPDVIDYCQQNLVLASAAAILYLYSLQRLSRPESIIT